MNNAPFMSVDYRFLRAAGVKPALAALAACRAAAQSIRSQKHESLPNLACPPAWVEVMAGEIAPSISRLTEISQSLPGGSADAADIILIRALWSQLGTTESLMETGGDIRLATDPVSALNGYGCSHRPRPWAITFASSTASSCSERGYAAAETIRLQTTAALLQGCGRQAVAVALAAVRDGIAGFYGLQAGCEVVLAASGTDTELLALALTHLALPDRPILNILLAPEETGRGVPMAARGLHFAVDTALGHAVTFESAIAGFRPDTRLGTVSLREADGALRPLDQVEAELAGLLTRGIATGAKVILHTLDLSKTGLLAGGPKFLQQMRVLHGQDFDIVVDACQARLSPASLRRYLVLGATVLITGSKFFTGPPFAGAAILPPAIAARLGQGVLPAGLDAYFGRDEFPQGVAATQNLPATGNYGLALRWHAALAEMQAFEKIHLGQRCKILEGFAAVVHRAIAASAYLDLLQIPAIVRGDSDEPWERQASIFTFSIRAPHAPERYLTPDEARLLYHWLNADAAAILPWASAIAGRICHIGQPVKLPQSYVAEGQGVLRISAGARLISGEPSHLGMGQQARLAREFADLASVFEKIELVLAHWPLLAAANPKPRYRQTESTAYFEHVTA